MLSIFSVFSVLKPLTLLFRPQNLNTEDTEKSESTAIPAHREVLYIDKQNSLVRSGLRMMRIRRMKLNGAERARMRNVFAGNPMIEP